MSKKAKIEHDILDSKVATAVALFNEWIRWCNENDIQERTLTDIPKLFSVDLDKRITPTKV